MRPFTFMRAVGGLAMKSARIACGLVLAAGALLGAGAALASGFVDGQPFTTSRDDWDVACDNTLTCRAAGYQATDEPGTFPVSLRITQAGGKDAPIAMTLKFARGNEQGQLLMSPAGEKHRFQVGAMDIGSVDLRDLKADSEGLVEFTPEQVRAVLPVMLEISRVWSKRPSAKVRAALPELFKGGPVASVWVGDNDGDRAPDGKLSLAGLNEAMGTFIGGPGDCHAIPGARVRYGRGGEIASCVLPPLPLPMPVVKVAAPVHTRPADAALAKRIVALLNRSRKSWERFQWACTDVLNLDAENIKVNRLTDRRILLSWRCPALSPDQLLDLNWIANDRPPYAPRVIEAVGQFDASTMSIEFFSGRSGSDSGDRRTWHFNGQKFVLTHLSFGGPSRGFPGGAWVLPQYVARVVPAKPANSTTSKKP